MPPVINNVGEFIRLGDAANQVDSLRTGDIVPLARPGEGFKGILYQNATYLIADGSVTEEKIAVGAVTGSRIADDSIATDHILDLQVTTAKLAAMAVGNDNLADDSVQTRNLADDAVTDPKIASVAASKLTGTVATAQIAADAVTADKLSANSVVSASIVDGSVTTPKMADASVTDAKITAVAASKLTGVLTPNSIPNLNAGKINAGTFNAARIPNLNASRITGGTLDAARIPSIPASRIATGILDTARIPQLTTSKITSGEFGTARIADDAITTPKIAADAVGADQLAANAVVGASIVDGSVTASKLASSPTTGDILQYTAAGLAWADSTIPDGSVTNNKLATGISGAKITTGSIRANIIGNLPAYKITSGTFNAARIPNLNASKINAGIFTDAMIPNLNASKINAGTFTDAMIPNLNASKITGGEFGTSRIANHAITNNKLATGISGAKITTGAIQGYILTNIPASKINSGTFNAARIPNLNASKINAGTFNAARIPDISAAKITTGVVGIARIPDVPAAKITGTLAVARIPNLDASKITTGTIDGDRIAPGVITSSHIEDGSVEEVDLCAKNDPTNGQVLAIDTGTGQFEWVDRAAMINSTVETDNSLGGDGSTGDPLQIADDGVTTRKIPDGAVTAPKLADASVTNRAMADNAVSHRTMADDSVGEDELIRHSVTNTKLGDLSVGTGKIQGGAVTEEKLDIANDPMDDRILAWNGSMMEWRAEGGLSIPDGSITTPKLADGAVTDDKITSVSVGKLTGTLSDAQIPSTIARDSEIRTDDQINTLADARASARYTDGEKTKLAGVETGAEANVGVEYTQPEKTKLDGIEAGAQINVGLEYTQTEKTKLAGIEDGAEANVGVEYTQPEKTKLGGIETAATADQTGNEIVSAIDTTLGNEAWKIPGMGTPVDTDRLIPAGGDDGQLLAKSADTDYETEWVDSPMGTGGLTAGDVGNHIVSAGFANASRTLSFGHAGAGVSATSIPLTYLNATHDTRPLAVTGIDVEFGDTVVVADNTIFQYQNRVGKTVDKNDIPTDDDFVHISDVGDGLDQSEVDARVRALVSDWAEEGSTGDIPESRIPSTIARSSQIRTDGQIDTLADARASARYTDTEKTKLAGIETAASADQTGTEIVSAIDSTLGNEDWKTPGMGGGGLLSVSTDTTISGTGVSGNPLGIADDGVTFQKLQQNFDIDDGTGHVVLYDDTNDPGFGRGKITAGYMANDSVNSESLEIGAVGPTHLDTDGSSPSAGLVLSYSDDEGNFTWMDLPSPGLAFAATDDSIVGTGLFGDPLSLANNSVSSAKIRTHAVTEPKLAPGSVRDDKIADNAVGTRAIAPDAVINANIIFGAIDTYHFNVPRPATDGQVLSATGGGLSLEWEDGGLATVASDGTLDGDGTTGDPLRIATAPPPPAHVLRFGLSLDRTISNSDVTGGNTDSDGVPFTIPTITDPMYLWLWRGESEGAFTEFEQTTSPVNQIGGMEQRRLVVSGDNGHLLVSNGRYLAVTSGSMWNWA